MTEDSTARRVTSSSVLVQLRQSEAEIRERMAPLLAEHALTAEHWRIMAVIDDHPGIDMSTVAASAVVAAASLTRHVDRLVEQALVLRHVDPEDKRRVVLSLSAAGQRYAVVLRDAERAVVSPAARSLA